MPKTITCLVLLLSLLCSGRGLAATAQPVDPFAQIKRMGRGVNILGYDPLWREPAKARFQDRHFRLIREAGFNTVRINLNCLHRMDAEFRMPEAWFAILQHQVDEALRHRLIVILDLHDFTTVGKDPQAFRPRIVAFWRQVAARFQDAPDTVIFELLNEPGNQVTIKMWNEWIPELLAAIRATNPHRTVVVGAGGGNVIKNLPSTVFPEDDRNLIATVHYYEPMAFSHQGAPWSKKNKDLSGITWGTTEDRAKVASDLQRAAAWSQEHRRPILLGEFGAYDKSGTDVALRAAYVAHIARTAESLGWAWTYWQFDSDFVVYDIDRDRWVGPILKALVP